MKATGKARSIENGIDAETQQRFFALAERLRGEQDAETANRLGDELGRFIFGGQF